MLFYQCQSLEDASMKNVVSSISDDTSFNREELRDIYRMFRVTRYYFNSGFYYWYYCWSNLWSPCYKWYFNDYNWHYRKSATQWTASRAHQVIVMLLNSLTSMTLASLSMNLIDCHWPTSATSSLISLHGLLVHKPTFWLSGASGLDL